MSGQVGWYPDPGGQRGMFRHWDGTQWSQQLSPTPHAPPPGHGQQPPPPPVRQGSTPAGGPVGGAGNPYGVREPRSGALWWVLGGVLALALIIAAVIVVPQLLTGRPVIGGPDPDPSTTTKSLCPPEPTELPTEAPNPPMDGRVHAGKMSYPELGAPWSPPTYDNRVPFGRDTQTQTITVQENYELGSSWVASVLIAELAAGDGFFSPEQGSSIVTECIVGSFYGDNEVTRDDQRNEAITIDGREGWIVESQLSFDIENLETKGERLIVVIVRTTDTTSALYYASIPDTTPELVQPAEDLIDELQVED